MSIKFGVRGLNGQLSFCQNIPSLEAYDLPAFVGSLNKYLESFCLSWPNVWHSHVTQIHAFDAEEKKPFQLYFKKSESLTGPFPRLPMSSEPSVLFICASFLDDRLFFFFLCSLFSDLCCALSEWL